MNTTTSVGPVTTVYRNGTHRTQADVAGEPLWFESRDAALAAAPEAFAGALLMPTLARNQLLDMADPVCPRWRSKVPNILDLLHSWWNYPQILPTLRVAPGDDREPAAGTGLLFTGGADSFFSLLHYPGRIDVLIYVLDCDVTPQAPERLSRYEPHLREIAAELGIRAVVIRTNLRRHPAFRGPSWQQTHGAALIAAGHLLRDSIGILLVSSSHPRVKPENWGTHWDLDPLWSSALLDVKHYGEETRRSDKIRHLVDDPLAQRFLRPCWENPPNGLNCSVCEKCVRTQLVIARWGDLSKFTAFDLSLPLARKLDGIRRIPRQNRLLSYTDCLAAPLPADCRAALAALIRRSRRYQLRKQITASLSNVVWPFRGRGVRAA
jgi:hypothetical protein